MDQETLRIILEAYNHASPQLKVLLADLKAVADQAKRTQMAVAVTMGDIRTSKSGKSYQTPAGGWRRMSTLDPVGSGKDQMREAQRVIKVRQKAEADAAKAADRAAANRARFVMGNFKQEQRERASAAREEDQRSRYRARLIIGSFKQEQREKSAADKEEDQRQANRARFVRGSWKQEQRERAAAEKEAARSRAEGERQARQAAANRARFVLGSFRQEQRERVQAEREAEKQAHAKDRMILNNFKQQQREKADIERRAAEASQTRKTALNSLFSGAGDVAGGVGRISGAVLGLGRNLVQAAGFAYNLGKSLVDHVIGAAKDVEKYALIAAGAITVIGGAVAKSGLDFNQFKQNTMLTLTALTKSGETAKNIFKGSFDLAIPSKFMVEEVLEGARTLEAFGIKYERFGQNTGRYLKGAVALAQGMDKPLQQVTRFLGNLSQGRLLLQQAAPLGMGRQTLQKYGVEFDSHGSPTDRTKLLEAAMKAIEERWGSLINLMENSYESKLDAMVSMTRMFGGEITEGMFTSFARAFGNVADFFKKLLEPKTASLKSLVEALKTPFDLLGSAVENASKHLPQFAEWLSKVLTKESIINFLAEIISMVRVMSEDIKTFVDQHSGGKGLVGMWESFRDFALDSIDAVMETWTEFKANLDFAAQTAPELWNMLVDGAQRFAGVLEVIAGLMVVNFGAQTLGGILQVIGGLKNIGGGLKGLSGGKGAVQGGMGGGMGIPAATYALGPAKSDDQLNSENEFLDYMKWIGRGGSWNREQGPNPVSGEGRALRAKQQTAIDNYRKAHPEYRAPGEPAIDPAKAKTAIDSYRKAHPEYRAPGEKFSTNFDGAAGTLQGIGRWALGGAIDFGKSTIPDGFTDWNARRDAFVKSQMGDLRDKQARRNKRLGYKQEAVDAMNSMTGGKLEFPGDKDDGMPPSTPLLKGLAGRWDDERKNAYLADPEIADAKISAYEKSFKGQDRNTQATMRANLIPLYKERLSGEQGAIRDAMEEMKVAVNSSGEQKSDDEKKADVIKYWKAVEQSWTTQAEIQEIQRQAVDAVSDRMKEANEARTAFVEAQIEMLPDSQKAYAKAENLIPMLIERQQIVFAKLKNVAAGSKEYYEGLGEAMRLEKQIVDTKNDSIDEAAKQAFEGPKRQFGTLKKLINMLPKGMQQRADVALLGPRVQQAFGAAQMERDPIKRQEKLLEVADMFTEMQEAKKQSDPYKGLFDKAMAGERGMAVRNYQNQMSGRRGAKRYRVKDQQNVFGAMSPFQGGVGGGTGMNGDKFFQMIFNLPVNASEEQMADLVMRMLSQQMQKTYGR